MLRRPPLPLSIVGFALAFVACARLGSEASPPPPEQSAATRSEPTSSSAELPALSEQAQAYLASCHHRFQIESDEGGGPVEECLYREFDQNCAPDPSGCWERGQSCREGCGAPCASCDDACAGNCDGCVAACKDEACRHRCAQARVRCRDDCLAARDQCSDVDCTKAEEACNAAHLALREETCPRCEQINDCMVDAINHDRDPGETCRRKFKREPEECFEWCFEW